ncbi:MAG: hypothetical protein ABSF88_02720 [Candidatus Aminicenantales bacterium]
MRTNQARRIVMGLCPAGIFASMLPVFSHAGRPPVLLGQKETGGCA